jgi:hypothetical protein
VFEILKTLYTILQGGPHPLIDGLSLPVSLRAGHSIISSSPYLLCGMNNWPPSFRHLRNSISLIHVSLAAFGVCDLEHDRAWTSSRLMEMGAWQKTGEAYTRLPMVASNKVQQVSSFGFTSSSEAESWRWRLTLCAYIRYQVGCASIFRLI